MGGSRRRHKQARVNSKVRVGLNKVAKRKVTQKSRVPSLLADEANALPLESRLKSGLKWDAEQLLKDNYKQNKLASDPNVGFGRNKKEEPLKERLEDEDEADDDELRAGCNMMRKSGPAAPQRLTPHQRLIVKALVEKHGEDVKAMVLDMKLNKMQHSSGQLKKMIAANHHWEGDEKERHDFRAPRKKPSKVY
jgi:nucleolar protein 16